MNFSVTDDSGFLALLDSDTYKGFLTKDWELDALFAHFASQMRAGRLLLWGTGLEHIWPVHVAIGSSPKKKRARSFREAVGPITASRGRLLVTNYESLTMAASYARQRLPQAHESDQMIDLPAGEYRCTVRQLCDPESEEAFECDPAFELLLSPSNGDAPRAWDAPPWFSGYA